MALVGITRKVQKLCYVDIFWFKCSITVLTLIVSSSSFTDTKMASGGTSVEAP